MKIALIDNYDSFTYNLAHLVKALGAEVSVMRNDCFELGDLEPYDKILLSPGPGVPSEAGLLEEVIRCYAQTKPILGICLGEQAIGEVFGGRLVNLSKVFHGLQKPARLLRLGKDKPKPDYLFMGLPEWIPVGRYHSWVVDADSLPDCLEATAISEEDQIMALRHRSLDVRGLQFHPESVLTPSGRDIILNWLKH